MRVFLTGASGWIGSATIPELLQAGHEVLGLARSDEAAAKIEAAGATPHRGSLEDLDSLRAGAAQADGVIHMGYNHDFSDMPGAAKLDRAAIDTFAEVLEGTDKPLIIASGVLGLSGGERPGTERDIPPAEGHPRLANAAATLALAERGIRSVIARFAPTVHGEGDHGFVAAIVAAAREKGVSAYVGDGANRWPAVHRLDAGSLLRHAVDQAPAGSIVHGIAEEGVPIRDVAEVIGRQLDLPVESIDGADVEAHFGWLSFIIGLDLPTSSAITQDELGWKPIGPTLLEDLEAGHYTK